MLHFTEITEKMKKELQKARFEPTTIQPQNAQVKDIDNVRKKNTTLTRENMSHLLTNSSM